MWATRWTERTTNQGPIGSSSIPNCALAGPFFHLVGQSGLNVFRPEPTAVGTNVPVNATTTYFDPVTLTAIPVSMDLTFSNVTTAGETTVTASSNAAATLTSNFAASLGGYQAVFFDISTTAAFSGPVTLCIPYPDANDDGVIDGTTVPETALSLLHEEGNPLTFVDRTVSRDTVNNVICGEVTSFSHVVTAVRVDGICANPNDPCDDGDACTVTDVCDSNNVCVGSGTPNCDDGSVCTADSCVSPGGCVHAPAPATGCLAAPKSLLKLVHKPATPDKDALLFKWINGQATAQGDFGDPTSTEAYSVCVFDSNSTRTVTLAEVSGGGTCGTKPCWKPISTKGYVYGDKTGAEGGITLIKLLGSDQAKTKVLVKGKGDDLSDAPLPLVAPVRAQVIRETPGLCFESTFTSDNIKKNDGVSFKAVAP